MAAEFKYAHKTYYQTTFLDAVEQKQREKDDWNGLSKNQKAAYTLVGKLKRELGGARMVNDLPPPHLINGIIPERSGETRPQQTADALAAYQNAFAATAPAPDAAPGPAVVPPTRPDDAAPEDEYDPPQSPAEEDQDDAPSEEEDDAPAEDDDDEGMPNQFWPDSPQYSRDEEVPAEEKEEDLRLFVPPLPLAPGQTWDPLNGKWDITLFGPGKRELSAANRRWLPVSIVGKGSFGVAALWVHLDSENNVRDRMVGKDVNFGGKANSWFNALNWADNELFRTPKEVYVHRLLCSREPKPRYIIGFRGFHLERALRICRVTMDYAEYQALGELEYEELILKDRPAESVSDDDEDQYEDEDDQVDLEAGRVRFALELFAALVDACQVMETHNIIHRDIKADNVFLSAEKDSDFHGWGFKPLLGDFGTNIFKTSTVFQNPGDYDQIGTPGFYAPEMMRRVPPYLPDPMDQYTNVYNLALAVFHWVNYANIAITKESYMGPWSEDEEFNPATEKRRIQRFLKPIAHKPLKDILASCLQWLPANRPTLAKVGEDVQDAINKLPKEVRPTRALRFVEKKFTQYVYPTKKKTKEGFAGGSEEGSREKTENGGKPPKIRTVEKNLYPVGTPVTTINRTPPPEPPLPSKPATKAGAGRKQGGAKQGGAKGGGKKAGKGGASVAAGGGIQKGCRKQPQRREK